MSDYTPTEEEVRTDYVMAYADRDSSQVLADIAFDRFIAKVKADTLREAASAAANREDDIAPDYECAEWSKWIAERADKLEKS